MTVAPRVLRAGLTATCLLGAVLAGCATASGGAASTRTRASATPRGVTIPTIQTTALNGYMAAYVWPTAHGFIFTGNPGTTAQQIGPAGAPALYYYDAGAQAVRTAASASAAADGTSRGIQDIVAAGDWVIYLLADSYRSHWEVWALNLTTGQRSLVSSAPAGSLINFNGGVVTDGAYVVWSTLTGQPSATQYVMATYDLANGQSHTLLTSTAAHAMSIVPVAIAGGTFVFVKTTGNAAANGGSNTASDSSAWLWRVGDAAPQQLSTSAGRDYSMSGRYIVWDNVPSFNLTLYDRATGQETDGWLPSCIEPQLAQTRPYLVCLDRGDRSFRLVRVPAGDSAAFAAHQEQAATLTIVAAGDRACWVAASGGGAYGSAVQCFVVPES